MPNMSLFPFCCGALIMGNLSEPAVAKDGVTRKQAYDMALSIKERTSAFTKEKLPVFATTVPYQTLAIRELEQRGFVPLCTMPGQHADKTKGEAEYEITLWGVGVKKAT